MNFYKADVYRKRVKEHYDYVCNIYGAQRVIGVFLFGSQNYGLATKDSDVDTKCLVMPSYEDLIFGQRVQSKTLVLENNEHIEVRDIRGYVEQFCKQNINMLEILFTKYYYVNPKYAEIWRSFVTSREEIAHYHPYQAIKTMMGMVREKYNQLFKDTPSHGEDIPKYGYSRKEYSHMIRVAEFIKRYYAGEKYEDCLEPKTALKIREAKIKGYDVDEVRAAAAKLLLETEQFVDEVLPSLTLYPDNEQVDKVLTTNIKLLIGTYFKELVL